MLLEKDIAFVLDENYIAAFQVLKTTLVCTLVIVALE